MKLVQKLFATAFMMLLATYGNAQYNVQPGFEEKLKSGTTFVVMKNPDSPVAKSLQSVINRYWNFSKVEYITPENINQHLAEGNFFLTFGFYEERSSDFSSSTNFSGIETTKSRIYLELWTPQESYLKKKTKPFMNDDRYQVARVELAISFAGRTTLSRQNYIDIYVPAIVQNWGPGYLKNQIQHLSAALKLKGGFYYDSKKEEDGALKKLSVQKLLVPEYALYDYKTNCVLGKCVTEDIQQNAGDIFADYKGDYEVIGSKELDEKIAGDSPGFYYLSCITSGTDKYISVVSSEKGEIIYLAYVPVAHCLKSKDIKNLAKKTR